MQRRAPWVLAAWLIGMSPALGQGLPEGTFASTKEGCEKLAGKTPAELGADLDFYVLTKAGVTGYLQRCDFLTVTPHDAKSWVATAFCDEQGYIYPDLFAIAAKTDGKLSVTRVTDLTQEPSEAADDSSVPDDDLDPSELDRDHTETGGASESGGAGTGGGDASTNAQGAGDTSPASDAFNTYVRCENVKP